MFFWGLPDYFEKKYDIEQREVRISKYGLDDRYVHYLWDCEKYVYYLNDYMIDLEDMKKNDKMLFLKYSNFPHQLVC